MAGSSKDKIQEFMMMLNPGSVIGLDIGAHSIKVCELSGSPGRVKLEKFGVFPLSEAAIIEDEIQKPSEITEGVLQALTDAGIKSKNMCLGLYGPNTVTKRLNTPEGSDEEIEDNIMWEAEQYIPFDADESMISFHVIGDNEGGGKDVVVAAAKIEVIDSFIEVLKEIKLNVSIVDLNVLALCNVFEEFAGDKLEEYAQGTLLIDFGAQSTKIVVYKDGGPIFTKELLIGGGLVTEEIQRQMGVSYNEAEDLKTTLDENGNHPEEILSLINVKVDEMVSEVRKSINFYVTQGSAERVEYCFVTGGSIALPGLVEKLSVVSNLQIEKLDVLSAIKVDEKKLGDNIDQVTAISPIVIGLAMRKFDS